MVLWIKKIKLPLTALIGYTVINFIKIVAQIKLAATFLTTALTGDGSNTSCLELLSALP